MNLKKPNIIMLNNIHKMKIMASGPITSWEIDGETVETVSDFTFGGSKITQMVKRLPTMWETQVRSLGWEDPLEKEMETCFSTLAWKIPWVEEPGRLQSMGSLRVRHD